MSLPREPRQKMINMMYLVLTALLALNVSSEILNAFKVVDRSLQKSSTNITGANDVLYKSLTEKLSDPQQGANARIWQPIAVEAQKLSKQMYEDIDTYKLQLKEEAGGKPTATDSTFKEDNLDAGTRYFDKKGKGKELFDKLTAYRKAMLALNPEIAQTFDKTLQITLDEANDGTFTRKNFFMSPAIANLTMLSKFQNDVKNSENQVVTYCHSKLGQVKVQFDSYAALVGQSSEYLMPGQNLKIRAGVGAFSTKASPRITINGQSVNINAEGVAELEVPGGGTGKKTANVSISYTTQTGEVKTENRTVEWVVGQPGSASVSADFMNVFYLGVPNKVSVGTSAGWDKTTVNWGGLSPSGSNGNYSVSPSGSEREINIQVVSDGKSSSFPFRIKRLPPASVFCAGQKSGPISTASLVAQGGLVAKLENSDFAANYAVVSYKVTINGKEGYQEAQNPGNRWSGSAATLISKLKPGNSVTFENIKVQGPDGLVRPASNEVLSFYCR